MNAHCYRPCGEEGARPETAGHALGWLDRIRRCVKRGVVRAGAESRIHAGVASALLRWLRLVGA